LAAQCGKPAAIASLAPSVDSQPMQIDGKPFRTIWLDADRHVIVIDQTKLPHRFETCRLQDVASAALAIRDMWVRGAPLIGATAAYGMALAMRADPSDSALAEARGLLLATRPTAVNLRWALDEMQRALHALAPSMRVEAAYQRAAAIAEEDVIINAAIGNHGLDLIRRVAAGKAGCVNILTHCNAGWLATVDWGTATAPIYKAQAAGIDLHVWVDETRPRNQGAALTAWELGQQKIPHTLIVDNAGGYLMQRGAVDLVLVGTDRTTAAGDVCNKIGTYLKALAAFDNGVPFYVAAPSPSIDFSVSDGLSDIEIEMRGGSEVSTVEGIGADGNWTSVRIAPPDCPTLNPAFDVTPARLVTGLITERGIVDANPAQLAEAFPHRAPAPVQ
jgi:methylthioribose-1-phosphate isomerase